MLDMEKATKYLSEDTRVFVDTSGFEDEIETLDAQIISRFNQLRDLTYATMGNYPVNLSANYVFDFLFESGVPERYWKKGKKESYTKNGKKKMIEDLYEVDFNELHIDWSSKKRYRSSVKSILNNVSGKTTVKGNGGKELVEIPYQLSPIDNRRFSTYDENVIGFYGNVRKSLEVPEGYLLLGADFPQIDGKGAIYSYFKTDKMLEIAETTKDTYLVFKELARHVKHLGDLAQLEELLNGEEFADTSKLEQIIQKFNPSIMKFDSKGQRDTYKVISLATTYNSEYSPFKKIQRAMLYLKSSLEVIGIYRYMSEMAIFLEEIGHPVTSKSRFGHKSTITKVGKGGILAKIFNTPIQTTSSEILLMFIIHMMDHFRNLGYTKEDIRVYVNRHDEPLFQIKKEVFVDNVEFIKSAAHILIDGWYPFEIGWDIGYSYGSNEPEFRELLDSVQYDDAEINQISREHIYDPEPLLMDLPEIAALTYRILPDGKWVCIVSRHIGEVNTNTYHFKEFRDDRKVEYTMFTGKLTSNGISRKELINLVTVWIKGLDDKISYVVAVDDDGGSQNLAIGTHNVFITGKKIRLHRLNKTLMGAVMIKSFESLVTEEDRKFASLLNNYQCRLVKRSL